MAADSTGFSDLEQVRSQVSQFRKHEGLLLWYIADEPDGPPTPLDAVARAADLIRSIDLYHPTAIVLNCDDYHWSSYTSGVDILLVDVYSIGINPIWSKKWSTPVTPTFGASGCDRCEGNYYDLSRRLETWRERARIEGRTRDLVQWVVPQAFDDEGQEFWWRVPEGREEAVQIVLAWNHGAMGHCAWIASSATPELLNVDPNCTRRQYSGLTVAERLIHRSTSIHPIALSHRQRAFTSDASYNSAS
jgi:hypothetical protein